MDKITDTSPTMRPISGSKAWARALPDYDPIGGKKLDRFGWMSYENTGFLLGDKKVKFKDFTDEEIIEWVSRLWVKWDNKKTRIRDLHPDLRTAVEMSYPLEWSAPPFLYI